MSSHISAHVVFNLITPVNPLNVLSYLREFCSLKPHVDFYISFVGSFSSETSRKIASLCYDSGFDSANFNILETGKYIFGDRVVHDLVCSKLDSYQCVFFVSSRSSIQHGSFRALLNNLFEDSKCCGVNPVLASMFADFLRISCMGIVADSQQCLHYLYYGLPAHDLLVARKRYFQLAHSEAFLVRSSDYALMGKPNPALDDLAFSDFCLRLHAKSCRHFAVIPEATAIYDAAFDVVRTCGLWNSLQTMGKLPPDLIRPDYLKKVTEDGLEYGITGWLQEKPAGLQLEIEKPGPPWLEWYHDQQPETLLRWLKKVAPGNLAETLVILRELPSLMPAYFDYYVTLAMKKLDFAIRNNCQIMRSEIDQWLKHKRIFHYRQLRRGMKALQSAGLYNVSLDKMPRVYDAWMELAPNAQTKHIAVGRDWPKISVLMPVYNPEPAFFVEAINSLKAQNYHNWQLCLADDASTRPDAREIICAHANDDKRIQYAFRRENGHISRATNTALALADGLWCAQMDQDDMLPADAMAEVANLAGKKPELRVIYTDSDKIDSHNLRRYPVFNPDYGSDLNFSGHLACYETGFLRQLGGLKAGYEGAQDQDLLLRALDKCVHGQIGHIARILYHWRVHSGSTSASIAAKPYVIKAMEKTLLDAARRNGQSLRLVPTASNLLYRKLHALPAGMKCSLALLADSSTLSADLEATIASLADRISLEILWQPLIRNLQPPAFLNTLPARAFMPLAYAGRHWWEAYNNAIAHAGQPLLFFLYTGLSPLPDCSVEQLLIQAMRSNVAAAGAIIWKNGLIWNGGFYPDLDGWPFALLKGTPGYLIPYYLWGEFLLQRRVMGVAWQCMAVRKELLSHAMIDGEMGHWATIDFSLKMAEKGRHTIVSPWGQWTLKQDYMEEEITVNEKFFKRWAEKIKVDGLRNYNLRAAPDKNWTLILPGQ